VRLGVAALVVLCGGTAAAADVWTDPYPGIRHLERMVANPASHVHAVLIDLTRRDLRLRATRYADRGRTVSRFARDYGCVVAVNGDFFKSGYTTEGLAMGRGERWPGSADGPKWGFVAAGKDDRLAISLPSDVDEPADWMFEIVGGYPLLVDGGQVSSATDCSTSFCSRNPRTAAGLTQDGRTLILVVVDGRENEAVGMSLAELARLMLELGAWRAINFDGGGSSAMYVANEGGIVNTPSDGTERVVGNHLGVAEVMPFGTIAGEIDADGAPLAGASVKAGLSAAVTDAAGLFILHDVPAGEIDVVAAAPGRVTKTQRVTVFSEDTAQVSLALARGQPGSPDAGSSVDAARGQAAGNDTDIAGGCSVGGRWSKSALAWVLTAAALMLARARLPRRRRPGPSDPPRIQ
jgi:phosphodiester glycosidase/carboxypeptidase family protein